MINKTLIINKIHTFLSESKEVKMIFDKNKTTIFTVGDISIERYREYDPDTMDEPYIVDKLKIGNTYYFEREYFSWQDLNEIYYLLQNKYFNRERK